MPMLPPVPIVPSGLVPFRGSQSMGGNNVVDVADPVNAQDATNKEYVDTAASGVTPKIGVLLSTQTALPANTYNNGSAGVGATLTGNSPGVLLIDNVEVAGGDRVLVKDEADPANNGVYTCTTMGDTSTPATAYVLTRATDSDTGADLYNGSYWTQEGALNAGTAFYLTNSTIPDIGTDALEYLEYTAGVGVQAGIGLVRLGQTIQVETVLAAVNTVFSPTATAAAQIAALGLVIGTNVEAWSAVLDALSAVMSSTATAAAQRTALGLGTVATEALSTDGTMAANSDSNVPSQKAVVTYVQAFLQGLSVKPSVRLATVAALPTNAYSNGSGGVGATLTASAAGVLTVDGNTVNLNDRVLVQNEAAPANNGIYQCTTAGASGVPYVLTRTADSDTSADLIGAFVFVEAGSVNASSGFVCLNNSTITIGTTGVGFTQFSGAGEITAGTGLAKAGNIISADSVLSALDAVMSATPTAAAQRTALGLTIGTNVEAWSAVLDALASVMSSTATVAAQQAALSLVPGTNVQAYNATLTALGTVMSATATAAAQRAALGLTIGTNVEAWSAVLDALASVMSSTATVAAQQAALSLVPGANVEAWSPVLDALASVMSSTATVAAQQAALSLVPGTNVQAYNATLTALGTVMSATATAAAQRTALGLTIGTNVEAWSAVLDALASVMSSTATAAAQRTALGLGASSVWNNVVRETPAGTVNGTNTTFTLANTPVTGSEQVFLNGLLQEPGSGNDYTISGATITYLAAPLTGDRLRVTYSH